ncbi:hypothetical protein [Flavihumibacter sp. UBA7668]|uniref:hypothetical protein n=1 Tax=Flavihumibacter sp. UBA7668 TaxID=1946542 RepID=UPI0025C175B3|nr:hypothetical protein [Flavihumibacter sp. UBA7668]
MSKPHLSMEDLQQILELAKSGLTPEEIAQKFNVAVSTIHYHKGRWKKQGWNFPDIRGRRPQSFIERAAEKAPNFFRGVTGQPFPTKQFSSEHTVNLPSNGSYKFVVNGTTVTIDSKAKSVEIQPDRIIVNF